MLNFRNPLFALFTSVAFATVVLNTSNVGAADQNSENRFSRTGAVMPMADTWDRILGFLDYAYIDLSPDEIAANAPNYMYVWSGMAWQSDQFRNSNPLINFGQYRPAFLDHYNARPDPIPEDPDYDTPEVRARTLLWWNTEADGVGHPDWVMYTCDRTTPAYYGYEDGHSAPNMPLDFSNPDVVGWQVRNIDNEDLRDYTAVSADLVYLRNFDHACGVYLDGEWVQLFTGEEKDPAYEAAVLAWAGNLRARLHSLWPPQGLVANFPPFGFYSDEEISAMSANLDGVFDESGFTAFGRDRVFISG